FFLPSNVCFFPRKVFEPVSPLSHVLVNKHLGVSVKSKTNGLGKIWLGSSVSTHGEKVKATNGFEEVSGEEEKFKKFEEEALKEYEKVEALAKSRIPSSTERGGSHYESHARWNKFFDYALKTRFGESGYFTFEEPSQEDLRDDMIFYFEFEVEGVKEFCSIRCAYKGIKLTVHGMKKATVLIPTNLNLQVFYVEACESGSVFEGLLLPEGLNIYATTASNAEKSSCPGEEPSPPLEYETFLVYRLRLCNSGMHSFQTETLHQ
ncbi:unnamed protein product, partial [Arabidopsis halleri]